MARMLAYQTVPEAKIIIVTGIIMIDSPFHIPRIKDEVMPEAEPPDLPALVKNCLAQCKDLLNVWDLPRWDDAASSDRETRCRLKSNDWTIPPQHVLYVPVISDPSIQRVGHYINGARQSDEVSADNDTTSIQAQQNHPSPPTAALLRATEPVPSNDPTKGPVRTDRWRHELLLGWDERYPEFIKAVIDLESHHYNIFEYQKVSTRKQKGKQAKDRTCGNFLLLDFMDFGRPASLPIYSSPH
jgi:hypothetical protein